MSKINTRVTFNKASVTAKIKAVNNEALTDLGNQVIEDSNMYCPHDQGALEDSALSNSDMAAHDGKFTVKWATPYARYQYYGVVMDGRAPKVATDKPLKYTKSSAQKKWAEYARTKHGEEWKKIYQAALRRRLHGATS